MIKLEEVDRFERSSNAGIQPKCPFCEAVIEKILMEEIRGHLGKRYLYFCSVCCKVLGISHRKGFWMG